MAVASFLHVLLPLWLGAHAQALAECLQGTCGEDSNTDETNLAQLRSVRVHQASDPCAELLKSGSCTTIGSMGSCFSGTICAGDITEENQNSATKCCKPKASSGFDMGDMFGGSGTTPQTAPTAPPAAGKWGGFDMGDMLGGSGATPPTRPPPVVPTSAPPAGMDDMFGGSGTIPGMAGMDNMFGGDGTPVSAAAAHSKEPPAASCPDAPSNLNDMLNGELKKRGGCGASDCVCGGTKGKLTMGGCSVCQ